MTAMEGWRDCENFRGWSWWNKQQASDFQTPLICSFFWLNKLVFFTHPLTLFIRHPYRACLWFPPFSSSAFLPQILPLSPLPVSGKLITLSTLLDFLWTVHLAFFLGAALLLIHCLFTLWQWKGKQYWVQLTGGDEESATLGHATCGFITSKEGYGQNQINSAEV